MPALKLSFLFFLIVIGFPVSEDQLEEVARHAGVLDVGDDYLTQEFRQECQQYIADPAGIQPNECKEAYLFLKQHANVNY